MHNSIIVLSFVLLLLTPCVVGALSPLGRKQRVPIRVSVTGGRTHLRVKEDRAKPQRMAYPGVPPQSQTSAELAGGAAHPAMPRTTTPGSRA